jgi:3-oxoacyl-[acyl-carrier protein] reductase
MQAPIDTRTALVGGGARGIGRAIADRLAGSGYRVVLAGRHQDTLACAAAEFHPAVGTLVQDISRLSTAGAEQAVRLVESTHGPLGVVVLNAGGPPPGAILDVTDEQWAHSIELLLLGPLRLARAVLPRMAERGFGRVILVTSTAVRQPQPDLAISVVLRSAVTAAAKLLSCEFASSGVTVNCVAPGPTATDRRTEILNARAAATGAPVAYLDARDAAFVPAGRAGRPEEIAAAVEFLASASASYVNGTVLTVDGGRTETI